jgi:hypothetical protein
MRTHLPAKSRALLASLALLCVSTTTALGIGGGVVETRQFGLFTYTFFSLFGGTATIADYPDSAVGTVTIPATIDGIPVVGISTSAFDGCSGLTSISIPSSVTSIGSNAFGGCSGLASISVAPGSANFTSIDGVLFNAARTTLIRFPPRKPGEYTIPAGTNTISFAAFEGCTGLTRFTIPASVNSIGALAFSNCSSLSKVLFLGIPPAVFGTTRFDGTAPDFTIYYTSHSSGFTSPTWNGYPAAMIDTDLPLFSASIDFTFMPDGLRLMLTTPGILSHQGFVASFADLGRKVGVGYSPDLSPGSWIELGNFFESQGAWVFTDPDPVRRSRPSGYYRAFLRPVAE